MAKRLLVNLDYGQNEAQNMVIHKLSAAPGSPVEGQIYYNTSTDKLFIYNGGTWIDLTSQGVGTVTSVGVTNATNGGLSVSGSPITSSGNISLGHSNVLSSAQTTQGLYPIKIDKNGHISAYGSAVALANVATSGDYDDLTNMPITNISTYPNLDTLSPGAYHFDDGTSNLYLFKVFDNASVSGGLKTIIIGYDYDNDSYITIYNNETQQTEIVLTSDNIEQYLPLVPRITLNGSVSTTPSFYAPTTAGSSGKILKSSGSGAPVWGSIAASDLPDLGSTYIKVNTKGVANGVASLGADGLVPSTQLPSYVDDVIEVANYASLPNPGETGKIYITLDTNKTYRWGGSTYVEISQSEIHKYTATITGNGSATSFTINHGLGTRDVLCQIYDMSDYSDVIVDVIRTNTTSLSILFATAPTNSQSYRVVIIA